MTLTAAMLRICRYFDPIVVSILPPTETTMDVVLRDPETGETASLIAVPCSARVSATELFQLINLIESLARNRNPGLFRAHAENLLLSK